MTGLLGIIVIIILIGVKEWWQRTKAEMDAEIIRMQEPHRQRKNRS